MIHLTTGKIIPFLTITFSEDKAMTVSLKLALGPIYFHSREASSPANRGLLRRVNLYNGG